MWRSFALLGLAICSVYGGVCQAAPSITAVIDGVDYSNSFVVSSIAQGYSISGSLSNALFTFTFDATTDADPGINYRLSIGGDPTVEITIQQVYLGGPYLSFVGTSIATITDANLDGHASLTGLPFINTVTVDGAIVGQYDDGCDLTGAPGLTATCPLSQVDDSGPNLVDPTIQLKIAFSLTDGDFVTLNGSTSLNVPEPATVSLMMSGLLAAGGTLRKRRADEAYRVMR